MDSESILLPSSITYETTQDPYTAVLKVEPLFHGYGVTLGNALRRVLLSSMTGGSLTGVKIEGASHEFTTVSGVKEDIVELTLNLKQIGVKVHSETPVRLKLSKKGKGVVTAGDFEPNADVEIVDPSAVIATITDDAATFQMEAIAERGRGYVPTEEREKEELEIGWIKLDALFSPVKNVSTAVEPVRIGDITNYDRLVMTIETNGTVTPQEAVQQSTSILMRHLALLAGQSEQESA